MRRCSSTWARLLAKVFQADPLVCRLCGGPLEVVAYVTDALAIWQILEHLDLSPLEKPLPEIPDVVRVPVDDEGRDRDAAGLSCREPPQPHPTKSMVSAVRQVMGLTPASKAREEAPELGGAPSQAERRGWRGQNSLAGRSRPRRPPIERPMDSFRASAMVDSGRALQ